MNNAPYDNIATQHRDHFVNRPGPDGITPRELFERAMKAGKVKVGQPLFFRNNRDGSQSRALSHAGLGYQTRAGVAAPTGEVLTAERRAALLDLAV